MNCPICNAKLEKNARECFVCGYHLNHRAVNEHNRTNGGEKICPVCNSVIPRDDSICPVCGVFLTNLPEGNTSDELGTFREEEIKKADHRETFQNNEAKEPGHRKFLQDETGIEREMAVRKTKHVKVILILVLIAIFLLLTGIVFIFLLKDRSPDTEDVTSTELSTEQVQSETVEEDTGMEQDITALEEDSEPASEEVTEPVNIDDYCGGWNIRNSSDKELIIQKLTDDVVLFSLWYYGVDYIDHVIAPLEHNIAYFSAADDAGAVEGALIFNEKSIVVQITKSDRWRMPVETMNFEEWHEQPWEYERYGIDDTSAVQFVDVTTPLLYIYAGPGYDFQIVGSITDRHTYRIIETVEINEVEQISVWGRLLSGVGWINLNDAAAGDPGEFFGYILPDSATILLTYDDIMDLSKEQLRLARNGIYARHGRKFEDEELRTYFEAQWWYNGVIEPEVFSEDVLNEIEKSNAALILMYE